MFTREVYQKFVQLKSQQKNAFAVLLDPDGVQVDEVRAIALKCEEAAVDFLFLGGSLMISSHTKQCIDAFKEISNIPVILFPGSPAQVVPNADALLYLSLISGRNPEMLIGQHVVSAPNIRNSGLEIISTGYIVVDGGKPTTVSYMSHSAPIPRNKPDIALCTAWAGEMQGKHVIYMDAGSGADYPISKEMIEKVSQNIDIPLIVGGGIRTPEAAINACIAGAQIIVVGNAIESDPALINTISKAIKSISCLI